MKAPPTLRETTTETGIESKVVGNGATGKRSWLVAILFGLFFLSTNVYISSKRLLWFDEFNAIRTARLPDLATVWRVQNSWRGDSAPIVYGLMARFVYHLSGGSDISVRLLSAMAMTAALLVVFDCARRLRGGLCGLMALCVLCSSFLPYYGYEGRPYSLVVLFTSIALWLWLHTREDNTTAAVVFGVSIFLTVTMHFNGVLALVPFGLWELYRRRWRRPSTKLLAGIAGMLCAFGLCVQQMANAADWVKTTPSWCLPSVSALAAVYPQIFPNGMLVLTVFAILVCLVRTVPQPMDDAERLCWLFLTIPIAGFLLAEAVTKNFYNRYLIAILPGVAVAFACLVSRYLTKRSSVALFLLLAAGVFWRQTGAARNPADIEPPSGPGQQAHTRETLAAEEAIVADGKRIIITDFVLADEARYYSKRPGLYAGYELDDTDRIFCRYFPSICWTSDSVISHAKELAAIYPSNILLTEMSRAGFQVTARMRNPMVVYFTPVLKDLTPKIDARR